MNSRDHLKSSYPEIPTSSPFARHPTCTPTPHPIHYRDHIRIAARGESRRTTFTGRSPHARRSTTSRRRRRSPARWCSSLRIYRAPSPVKRSTSTAGTISTESWGATRESARTRKAPVRPPPTRERRAASRAPRASPELPPGGQSPRLGRWPARLRRSGSSASFSIAACSSSLWQSISIPR